MIGIWDNEREGNGNPFRCPVGAGDERYFVEEDQGMVLFFFPPPHVYFSLVFAEYHVSVHQVAAHPGMDDR